MNDKKERELIRKFTYQQMQHWMEYAKLVIALLPDDDARTAYANWVEIGGESRIIQYMTNPQESVKTFLNG